VSERVSAGERIPGTGDSVERVIEEAEQAIQSRLLPAGMVKAARQLGVCTSAIWHAIRRAEQSQLTEVKDVT